LVLTEEESRRSHEKATRDYEPEPTEPIVEERRKRSFQRLGIDPSEIRV
jgi:hypothetical protein